MRDQCGTASARQTHPPARGHVGAPSENRSLIFVVRASLADLSGRRAGGWAFPKFANPRWIAGGARRPYPGVDKVRIESTKHSRMPAKASRHCFLHPAITGSFRISLATHPVSSGPASPRLTRSASPDIPLNGSRPYFDSRANSSG